MIRIPGQRDYVRRIGTTDGRGKFILKLPEHIPAYIAGIKVDGDDLHGQYIQLDQLPDNFFVSLYRAIGYFFDARDYYTHNFDILLDILTHELERRINKNHECDEETNQVSG